MPRFPSITPAAALVALAVAAGVGLAACGGGSTPNANLAAPPAPTVVPSSVSPETRPLTTTTTRPTTTRPPTTTVPATTVPPTTTSTMPKVVAIISAPGVPLPTVPAGSVLEVGDSISLDAAPFLQASGVVVNGVVGRQFYTGISVVASLAAEHQLPPTLVVALGANGTVDAAEIDEMVQAAAGVRHLVFVDVDVPRSWEAGDNAALLAAPARYPKLVTVADWHTVAAGHPEWFTGDQVHLEPAGARALASLILAAVNSSGS